MKVFDRRVAEVIEASTAKQDRDEALRDVDQVVETGGDNGGYLAMEGVFSQWNVQEDKDTGEDIIQQTDPNEYNSNVAEMALKDISFEFGSKEKVAIIGKVGSGKTSLLLTILRELSIVKGSIKISGATHISYAEQNPLIMTGTVQSNIIFGSPLDQAWYDEVVTACALLEDFKQMANGDQTLLGEMGTQLSGGQKSRISLARALYKKESKIILIDGSLSALDARVARYIMDNAIKGPLCEDKIVLLVTYDLD